MRESHGNYAFKRSIIVLILLTTTVLPALGTPTNIIGPWGVDATGFKNLSTCLASPITAGKTVVITKPMLINNKTLPKDRHIKITRGGRIDVSSGKSFSFNGQEPDAGDFQIFGGSGPITMLKDPKPEWYNISGTGDQVAINKAIVSAISGSTVFLGHPPYNISGTIDLSVASGITLQGTSGFIATSSMPPSIKVSNGANCNAVKVTTGGTNQFNTLKDLYLEGNRANNSTGTGIEISGNLPPLSNQNRTLIQNIMVNGFSDDGIYNSRTEVTFRDIKVQRCGGDGIKNASSADTYWFNVLSGWNGHYGINIVGNSSYWFMVNAYNNGYDGVIIQGSQNKFFNLEADGNQQTGLHLTAPGGSITGHNEFHSCLIAFNSWAGNGSYSNLLIDGAGLVTANTFFGGQFYDQDHDGTLDSPSPTPFRKMKYLIEDARPGGQPGFLQSFIGSHITTDPSHFTIAAVTPGLFVNAVHYGVFDDYLSYPLDGGPYFETSIVGPRYTLIPRAKSIRLSSDTESVAIAISKIYAYSGQRFSVVNSGSNVLTFATIAGTQQVGKSTITLNQWDTITFEYMGDRWVRVSSADN